MEGDRRLNRVICILVTWSWQHYYFCLTWTSSLFCPAIPAMAYLQTFRQMCYNATPVFATTIFLHFKSTNQMIKTLNKTLRSILEGFVKFALKAADLDFTASTDAMTEMISTCQNTRIVSRPPTWYPTVKDSFHVCGQKNFTMLAPLIWWLTSSLLILLNNWWRPMDGKDFDLWTWRLRYWRVRLKICISFGWFDP